MNKAFKEHLEEMAKQDKFTLEDYKKLQKLETDKNFQYWRSIVEDFMLKTAINLMAGKACPEDVDPVSYFRGRYDGYVKAMRPVDSAEEVIIKLKQNEKGDPKETGGDRERG